MDPFNDVTDEEFVPFLNNLGVDSYKKSFEWMLTDPDFAGVLRWLYNNLDHNNTLNPREECRYAELVRNNALLSADELDLNVRVLMEQYPGLPLPGNVEDLEELKSETVMLKERKVLLEKQEATLASLIQQNELANDNLKCALSVSTGAERQVSAERAAAAGGAGRAARGRRRAGRRARRALAERLALVADTATDEEAASKFLAFGPFDSYRQSQALFRSHFDLFVSKLLSAQTGREREAGGAVLAAEARAIEERLAEAVQLYIESSVELSGEKAKLELAADWGDAPHHSQIAVSCLEEKSALALCLQEEQLLESQVRASGASLARGRGLARARAAAAQAAAHREQVLRSLTAACSVGLTAAALDQVLVARARREGRSLARLLQLGAATRRRLIASDAAVADRMDAMNALCLEQEAATQRHLAGNALINALESALGGATARRTAIQGAQVDTTIQDAPGVILRLWLLLEEELRDRRGRADAARGRKEDLYYPYKEGGLNEIKKQSQQLKARLFDGCTRQPNCRDRGIASLSHSLSGRVSEIEDRVVQASAAFTKVKGGDRRGLRKLWQKFLAAPELLDASRLPY